MRNLRPIQLLVFCFVFGNVSSQNYYLNIPAQNVSNNQEIKWKKPRDLQGRFDVKMVLLVSNRSQGNIWFSVGKGNTSRKEYPAVLNKNGSSSFTVNRLVTINPGDEIRIFYEGNKILEIYKLSYIHLTKRPNGQDEITTTNRSNTTLTTSLRKKSLVNSGENTTLVIVISIAVILLISILILIWCHCKLNSNSKITQQE